MSSFLVRPYICYYHLYPYPLSIIQYPISISISVIHCPLSIDDDEDAETTKRSPPVQCSALSAVSDSRATATYSWLTSKICPHLNLGSATIFTLATKTGLTTKIHNPHFHLCPQVHRQCHRLSICLACQHVHCRN